MRLRNAAAILVALALSACVTRGQVFDRAASDAFEIGRTTPAEAIAALGSPAVDISRPDGLRVLRWEYQQLRGIGIYRHVIGANFGSDGKLVYLRNPKEAEIVDPF
jgi:hypothetical protein